MLTGVLVFCAGALLSTMSGFNGVLQGYVGMLGVSLATHVVGGVLLVLWLLGRREKIRLGPMPWYLYSAGFLGLIQVAGSSLCVTHIGPALTACLSVAGSLSQSILVDHFGWLGMKKEPFRARRVPGLLVLLAGILMVNFAGQGVSLEGMSGGKVLYIFLAFLEGGLGVYSRAVNFQATVRLGRLNGSLVNYVTASILSLALMMALGQTGSWAGFSAAPLWVYLGGVCGVAAMIINMAALEKLTLLQSGILLLAGQLACSALLDGVLFHSMSPGKLLGVLVVAVGAAMDKKTALAGQE